MKLYYRSHSSVRAYIVGGAVVVATAARLCTVMRSTLEYYYVCVRNGDDYCGRLARRMRVARCACALDVLCSCVAASPLPRPLTVRMTLTVCRSTFLYLYTYIYHIYMYSRSASTSSALGVPCARVACLGNNRRDDATSSKCSPPLILYDCVYIM